MVIGLSGVQFWSEIILVISNRTHAARSFNFEITCMISDQTALHLVQLPLFMARDFGDCAWSLQALDRRMRHFGIRHTNSDVTVEEKNLMNQVNF